MDATRAPLAVHHYRALWPVLDEARPLTDLIEEAKRDLPGLLRMARLRGVGAVRWSQRPGRDVPGCGGARTVLLADVAVVRVDAAVDSVTGEVDRDRQAYLRAVPA